MGCKSSKVKKIHIDQSDNDKDVTIISLSSGSQRSTNVNDWNADCMSSTASSSTSANESEYKDIFGSWYSIEDAVGQDDNVTSGNIAQNNNPTSPCATTSVRSESSFSIRSLMRSASCLSLYLKQRRKKREDGLEIRQLHRCPHVPSPIQAAIQQADQWSVLSGDSVFSGYVFG